mgnify:CR=1 FL=1
MFILLEGINSNNGSIIIDPNSTDFISTLYPYQIFVDDTVFVINNEDDWDLDGDGVDQYVIPNLEAGTAYSLLMIDGNGCGYSNNGEYEYFGGSACIYLAKDDYAQIYASANIHDGNETSFSGFLIG